MNVEKLKRLQAQVRIGGKGTPRRKKKVVHQTATNDDKKLQSSLKKLSVSTIPGIEEVNIIKDDLTVIHFNNPKAQASLSANTFAVTGHGEHKKIVEMLPEILPQLGQETVVQLRMFANSMSSNSPKQQNAGAVGVVARGVPEEDDVPMLVSDFDEIAKVEAANDSKPAAPKQKSNDSLKALTTDTKSKNLNDENAQKESNNNQKQSEGSVAEKLNINVASMSAAEMPIYNAGAGKSQKEEQSDDRKTNAKANKNSKGDNKSQPRTSKPTAALKLTEDATSIAVEQTQNSAAKSAKNVEQKPTKDSDKKEVFEPVEGKQTKKHDKPKESKSNKKGQADKEGQQDKKKVQLEKSSLQISETKEIETETKPKKNQAQAMAVTPKEEERVQKQKSSLKSECKQKEEKLKQPPLQVQSQDVEKEIVQDTNVLELTKQQEPLKEAVLLVHTQDKKVNETEKDENSISPKDIQITQVVQQKTPKAQVMSDSGDTKVKNDAQKKGQAPKKEVTKKTETDIQIDQSAAKLTESTIDVVPQEHAPSKPKLQNKKKEKTPSQSAPVALENIKKDTNVQPPFPDIKPGKNQQEQPKRREQSPIPLKDIQKETCNEKEGQQVHALAITEAISKVTEASVKHAAKPDYIKTIANEQKNLFSNQPQTKQQTEHKLDEFEPMKNVAEPLETVDVRPSTNILEQMVKQVTDELKVVDASQKGTDKSIQSFLPNESLKSISKMDDVKFSLVESTVASKPAEVKQEAVKSSDECLKSSAPEAIQVTGLDMKSTAYQVPVSKPTEVKQEPAKSIESLKSSAPEGSEVMELNMKQLADLLPASKSTEYKEEPVKSVDEDLKSSTPELGQLKGQNIGLTEKLVSASKPAEVKQEPIMISGDECLKTSATEISQTKEVDIQLTADQVPAYKAAEAKQELIKSGDECLKSSTPEEGQLMGPNTSSTEDQVSAYKSAEIKKEPIKSCDEGLKSSSPEVSQSKEVDAKPTVVQVQQKPGDELEHQPIKGDNKMAETTAPPQKTSPPRQNANKKNTTPQLQDKEGAKQHQNKQAGGGNKATLQSEGKKMEAAKPKQASPVKTHQQQQQQQAGKQAGCNASKQQQPQPQQQVKAASNKSPEKSVVAPKTGSASTKSATPPKAATPTKIMAVTVAPAATSLPSQPKKSPTGEDGGSSAPIGKKQTQKEGGGKNKAKPASPKLATAPIGAATGIGAVAEGTAKQASPSKITEQAAATPQTGQQPSAN